MMTKSSYLTHDPSEYVKQLQQLLVSDKKRIAFLFGAGTSTAKKTDKSLCIPTIKQLTLEIENNLTKIYKDSLSEIKEEIGLDKYNIETLLSNLEQKIQIIGKNKLNNLTGANIKSFIDELKNKVREKVSIHDKLCSDGLFEHLVHVDFAEWIIRVDRKYPVEIFTTNYDYLFELGLESQKVPYYDGFTGSYQPFFNPDSVEDQGFLPQQTKLWKLHGSLGWHYDEDTEKVLRKESSDKDILIYPSMLKYSDSKKQPYISLIDRLCNFLRQEDAILITCGYSFGDDHINERILTALKTNGSAHMYSLIYDVVNNDGTKKYMINDNYSHLIKLAKTSSKISVYSCREAVIGCHQGKWKLKSEPNNSDSLSIDLYFDQDFFDQEDEKKKEKKGEEAWTGEGDLILPDFAKFVVFLKAMIIENKSYIKETK